MVIISGVPNDLEVKLTGKEAIEIMNSLGYAGIGGKISEHRARELELTLAARIRIATTRFPNMVVSAETLVKIPEPQIETEVSYATVEEWGYRIVEGEAARLEKEGYKVFVTDAILRRAFIFRGYI